LALKMSRKNSTSEVIANPNERSIPDANHN
jgi:hypothetical protein